MSKKALICGISGQDGSLLAKYLLEKGYEVVGTSRDAQVGSFLNLDKCGIRRDVEIVSMSLNDFRSVLQVVSRVGPDELYNFAGQSSVGLSFEQPVETLISHASGTLNLLEVLRYLGGGVRMYNASSGECYGDTRGESANEATPFRPRSPYGVAKAAAFWEAVNYREAYGIHVCSGILFNHESPLRPERFVTKKIINTACRIANGSGETLKLGNLAIKRDWGWAYEYVDAMWRMLQREKAEDYVVATGVSHSLEEFVQETFDQLSLDWREHVVCENELIRPTEIFESRGNAEKAKKELGWEARFNMREVIRHMIKAF